MSIDGLKDATVNSFRSFVPSEESEEDLDDIAEEDTYNPYEGMSIKAIEKEGVSVVSEKDIDTSYDSESVEESGETE